MSCDASYFEPLPCPKCGKKPLYVIWEHRHSDRKIHSYSSCGIRARKYTKQEALAKWNLLALKYAMGERREGE